MSGSDGPSLDEPSPKVLSLVVRRDESWRLAVIGQLISNYRIQEKLGEGGMGTVYLAEQLEPLRRKVAFKVIRAGTDSAMVMGRFDTERQALALMNHLNIARVYDAGTTPLGLPYFVMEYVEGIPITRYCDLHRLPLRDRLHLFSQVCDGVQHAHQKGIIHRDIKPSNVLVSIQDGRPVPKIIDFGVAKAIDRQLTEATVFTEVGQLVGTPSYMSPEQVGLQGVEVDTRTDVYSLGILLYEVLVLREISDTSGVVARNRRSDAVSLRRALRGDLDWVCLKALEKDRDRRYATASELAADIRRHLRHETVAASPPSRIYQTRKFVRRHRIGVAFAAIFAVSMVAFSIAVAVQNLRIAEQRDVANREAMTSKEVTDFLTDLFAVNDPWKARGKDVTIAEVLDRGARRVSTELSAQPEVQAGLMHAIGKVYRNLDRLSEAEPLLDRAWEIRRERLGDEDPQTLSTLSTLAGLYSIRGDYEQADGLYKRVLEIQARVLGEDDRETLVSRYNLALNSLAGGQLNRAEEQLRATRERQAEVLGETHEDTLASSFMLARVYLMGGQFEQAEPILRAVLESQRTVLGEDHPDTVYTLASLVEATTSLGLLDEAASLCTECIDRMRRVLGDRHNGTLSMMGQLAWIHQLKGDMEQAESLYRTVLSTREDVFGKDSRTTLSTMNELGVLLTTSGQYDEALVVLEGLVERAGRVLAPKDFDYGLYLHSLAELYLKTGKASQAEPLLRRALAIYEQSNPIYIGLALSELATVAARRFEKETTLTLLARAIENGIQVEEIAGNPDFRFLRDDQRFKELVVSARNSRELN
ncbi:MAG: serine/threonine-protein kinase [Acidobacteriota bacterium]